MAYEDKFRSVREEGPRPGTEVELVAPDPIKEQKENNNKPSSYSNLERPFSSILNDLEKMIVDVDGLFEQMTDEEYSTMLMDLISDAKEAARKLDMEVNELNVLKSHYDQLLSRASDDEYL